MRFCLLRLHVQQQNETSAFENIRFLQNKLTLTPQQPTTVTKKLLI